MGEAIRNTESGGKPANARKAADKSPRPSAGPRARREPASPECTRRQIADSAFELIDEIGPRAFSMRKLSARTGMSAMAAYAYFDSKEQLMAACYARLFDQVDNRPVPGERWDETLHRTCGSLYDVLTAHVNVREIMNVLPPESRPQRHQKHIYLLHRDQGMPDKAFHELYLALELFMGGFFAGATREKLLEKRDLEASAAPSAAADAPASESPKAGEEELPWDAATRPDYSRASFHRDVDWIIDAFRLKHAPDPCDWRTPEDAAAWTWRE